MSKIILVEGNISAGKSTLSRDLGFALGFKVFYEPVVTNPYLEQYYANPKEFALPMQLWLLKQRFETYSAALQYAAFHPGSGVLLDRSVFSDIVFAQKNYEDGNIDDDGFEEYLALRQQLLSDLPSPTAVVYLDVPAQICHDRVLHMRRRECESGIPLAYLAGLERCYERFLQSMEEEHGCAVLRKDWGLFGDVDSIAQGIRAVRPSKATLAWQPSSVPPTSGVAATPASHHGLAVATSPSSLPSSSVLETKDDDNLHLTGGGISPLKG